MKFKLSANSSTPPEVFHHLVLLQTEECAAEMINEMGQFLPHLVFASHAERLLAEDMFNKAWLLSRYLTRYSEAK